MSTQTESVSLDLEYLKSRQGLLRIGEALIGLSGIICESQVGYCGYQGMHSFYNFVVVTTLILALLILVTYSLGLDKFCTSVNCFLLVFLNDVLFAILYMVATILMFVTIGACRYRQVARIFAALFGVCGTVVVGLLATLGYQVMKRNQKNSDEGKSILKGNQSVPESDPA